MSRAWKTGWRPEATVLEFAAKILRSISLRAPRVARLLDPAANEQQGFVVHRGCRLPTKSLRGKMCGDAFRTDSFYYLSAVLEARKFLPPPGAADYRIVDIGSGLGRLATGLLAEYGAGVQYIGIDANRDFVRWCGEHIERLHPTFRFIHLDMANAMYNPAGSITGTDLRLPVADASADVVNLWGVFTNMVPEDVQAYLAEIARILRPDGRCFLTAIVEEDVPDVTINPPGFVPYECDTPLAAVRYSKEWMFSTFGRHGLRVDEFRYHGTMFPKQSEIYLSKGEPAGSPG